MADALGEIESTAAERPDEVYLFSTAASRWFVVQLRIGDAIMYDMAVDERYWKTGPDQLDNITGERRQTKA